MTVWPRAAWRLLLVLGVAAAAFTASLPAQQNPPIDGRFFDALRWRNVGPHRASRTRAAAGHRSHPYTFYMAAVNGGVWKTTMSWRIDSGRWFFPCWFLP